MRTLGCAFQILALALGLALIVGSIYQGYLFQRDIYGWQERAQVATLAEDIAEYAENLQVGMERYGLTNGYAAFLFTHPGNDLGLIYKAVQEAAKQAKVVATLDPKSDAYQQGIDNLRGTLRELEIPAYSGWFVKNALSIGALVLLEIALIVLGLLLALPRPRVRERRVYVFRRWWW